MTSNPSTTDQAIELQSGQVDLWQIAPQSLAGSPLLEAFEQWMNEEERQKQRRLIHADDRHDALVTRGLVRWVLSQYAPQIKPAQWQFVKGEKGKPEIVNPPLPLRFNLSHTKGMIVCGVTLQADLGVDVEYIHRRSATSKVAEVKFSEQEVAELEQWPQAQQKARFFDYWTLKESYIKAVGGGLSIPLEQFTFLIASDHDIRMSFDARLGDDPAAWQSRLLWASEDHRVAVSLKLAQQTGIQIRKMTPFL